METLAQLVLALLLVGVVLAYMNGGWDGVLGFFHAKVVGA